MKCNICGSKVHLEARCPQNKGRVPKPKRKPKQPGAHLGAQNEDGDYEEGGEFEEEGDPPQDEEDEFDFKAYMAKAMKVWKAQHGRGRGRGRGGQSKQKKRK